MLTGMLQKLWFTAPPKRSRERVPLGLRLLGLPLAPLTWPFGLVVASRRKRHRRTRDRQPRLPVAVVVVGNLTVGGSGKTPLVIALVDALRGHGFTPGVLSRGYGGRAVDKRTAVASVDADPADAADRFGDEAVLIRVKTMAPVFVGKRRFDVAARALLAAHPDVDVLIADDGLQHYALARNFEIVVFDARGAGNGRLLPAGPLREPLDRLAEVDAVVLNGADAEPPRLPRDVSLTHAPYRMTLVPGDAYRVNRPAETRALSTFRGQRLTAAAGIGHPERFFAMLRGVGLSFHRMPLRDHFRYTANPFDDRFSQAVLMTEKDAVKCRRFDEERMWAVPVRAAIDPSLVDALLGHIGTSRRPTNAAESP